MSEYSPDFHCPRFQKMARAVYLLLTTQTLKSNDGRVHEIHSSKIKNAYGAVSSRPGMWLRQRTLKVADNSFVPKKVAEQMGFKAKSKGYKIFGLELLEGILGMHTECKDEEERDLARTEALWGEFIDQKQPIVYKVVNDRKYHVLQTLTKPNPKKNRRGIRYPFFKGRMEHEIDIAAAFASILVQHALNLSPEREKDAVLLHPLIDYAQNRKARRAEMAARVKPDSEKPEDVIKEAVTSMLNGAPMVYSDKRQASIYQDTFKYDISAFYRLKTDEYFMQLMQARTHLWRLLRKYTGLRLRTGCEKSALYRKLERQVMDATEEHLHSVRVYFLSEHDGLRADKKPVLDELQQVVHQKTGFWIEFDYTYRGEQTSETERTTKQTDHQTTGTDSYMLSGAQVEGFGTYSVNEPVVQYVVKKPRDSIWHVYLDPPDE